MARVQALLKDGADPFCVRNKENMPAFHNAVFFVGFLIGECSSADVVERALQVVRAFCAAGM